MNAIYRRARARFKPEPRFEVEPAPLARFRVTQESELEQLKGRLLRKQLARISHPEVNARLQRAANEAAAVAWMTAYPLLVFPVLFEEKSRAALTQAQRQASIRERSREVLVG